MQPAREASASFYVDYLRRLATDPSLPTNEFYNKCHNPEGGPAGGQFCSDNVDFSGMNIVDMQTVAKLHKTVATISKVHDLPARYPKAYVEFDITNQLGSADGSYAAAGDQITLAHGRTGTEITFVHEFGHHVTLGEEGNYSLNQFQDKIDRTPTLRRWRDAVQATSTYESLTKRVADGEDYAGYLKDERELFARSYAQWIARRSRDATLNDQLERNRSKNRDFQWTDDEFTAIGEALDNHFRRPITAAAGNIELANDCHAPDSGRFCETPGVGERGIPVKPYEDEDQEFDRVAQLEKHYGRKEQAPEMGGIQWAFNGQSPVITEAAEDVLQGQPYDPFDRYTSYGKDGYDVAETILTTIENESSDVTLYSGHKRSREEVEQIIDEGVSFPLVATSPDRRLADIYAKSGSMVTPAVVFVFPPGSQAGFYQANEHIATGEYEVTDHQWSEELVNGVVKSPRVTITLRQTKRYTVPEKIYPDDEED